MNPNETYRAIMALQKDLSEALQDKPLSTGMYYREVQALAATYELQDYLANQLDESEWDDLPSAVPPLDNKISLIPTDLRTLEVVSQEEVESDFDAVAAKADISPVLIRRKDGRNLLLISWNEYLARFGALYTTDEIEAINTACRTYQEDL